MCAAGRNATMQRLASLAAALFALWGVPVFAAVKVVQGVAIGNVLFTVTSQRAGDESCYLARDRSGAEGMTARLWLLRSPDRDAATRADAAGWLKVEAGAAAGPVDLKADESNLFVVFEQGRILRFDRRALRLAEDLSPMLHPGRIRFFAADAQSYWVGQDGARAVEENETEPEAMTLWQIDRQVLDGGTFHAGAVPAGFEPLAT